MKHLTAEDAKHLPDGTRVVIIACRSVEGTCKHKECLNRIMYMRPSGGDSDGFTMEDVSQHGAFCTGPLEDKDQYVGCVVLYEEYINRPQNINIREVI